MNRNRSGNLYLGCKKGEKVRNEAENKPKVVEIFDDINESDLGD